MNIVHPSFQIEDAPDYEQILFKIERAGKTCYKTPVLGNREDAERFVKMIIGKCHESVIEHASMTVRFIIDRGVSHELVRHRLASFSQESTRYCNYAKERFGNDVTFVYPHWYETGDELSKSLWHDALANAETSYFAMLKKGMKPEDARGVLPNALKTEIVVTANLREWRTIFKQRCADNAHPDIRLIMRDLLKQVKMFYPAFFFDIQE